MKLKIEMKKFFRQIGDFLKWHDSLSANVFSAAPILVAVWLEDKQSYRHEVKQKHKATEKCNQLRNMVETSLQN